MMGEAEAAAVVVACLLQRSSTISIGGRLFARIDAESWGGRVLYRTRTHGTNQRQEPRAAIRLRAWVALNSC